MPKREGLRKRERLHGRSIFARIYQRRQFAGDGALAIYVAPNDRGWTRLGISVSKRVGPAVTRAYVRRRIREAFRRNKDRLPVGIDMICVARPAAGDRAADLTASLIALTHRAARKRSAADNAQA